MISVQSWKGRKKAVQIVPVQQLYVQVEAKLEWHPIQLNGVFPIRNESTSLELDVNNPKWRTETIMKRGIILLAIQAKRKITKGGKNNTIRGLPSRPSGPSRMYFKGPGGVRLNQFLSSENIDSLEKRCQPKGTCQRACPIRPTPNGGSLLSLGINSAPRCRTL